MRQRDEGEWNQARRSENRRLPASQAQTRSCRILRKGLEWLMCRQKRGGRRCQDEICTNMSVNCERGSAWVGGGHQSVLWSKGCVVGKWLSYLLPSMQWWLAASFSLYNLTEPRGLHGSKRSHLFIHCSRSVLASTFLISQLVSHYIYYDFVVNQNIYGSTSTDLWKKGFQATCCRALIQRRPLSNSPLVSELGLPCRCPMWATNRHIKSVCKAKRI